MKRFESSTLPMRNLLALFLHQRRCSLVLQYNELRKYISALASETGVGLEPTKPPQGLLNKTKKFLLENNLMRRLNTHNPNNGVVYLKIVEQLFNGKNDIRKTSLRKSAYLHTSVTRTKLLWIVPHGCTFLT